MIFKNYFTSRMLNSFTIEVKLFYWEKEEIYYNISLDFKIMTRKI